MYRLLVVDDLPIIVDGLLELFEQAGHLPLEVMRAYSGEEALEILAQHRIDIVVSDIKMPGIEGIQLLQEIKSQWPACKVIFLTGYNDFQYAKSAITYGGFDYILKVESDEKILASVQRAIGKIEEEQDHEQLLARVESKMRLALPSLQKDYVWGILQGKPVIEEQLGPMFKEMDMPLCASLPVYVLIGRVDAWREAFNAPDKGLLAYAFQNIGDELLSAGAGCYSVVFEMSKIVWLIQPKAREQSAYDARNPDWVKTHRYASGILETVQATCKKLLGLSVSFLLGSEAVAWEGLFDRFHAMKYGLAQGHGFMHEIIMTDRDGLREEENSSGAGEKGRSQADSFYYARIQLLVNLLENHHREPFYQQLGQLTAIWSDGDASNERKMELYHSLSSVFLHYVCKNREIRDYVHSHMELDPLFRLDEACSWPDMAEYFKGLADCFFEWNSLYGMQMPTEVVSKVHRYIEENIAVDISLTALADYVGLNPSYLSRLYKQITGIGLSKYVNDYKNLTAKDMLLNSSMKVNEIAAALGYNSALAFIRFFKKQNEMTPQDFRMSRIQSK
ncbi:response regulator [Paenibacillus sp. J5C_2022]|uniref:response regulator n=1 Tax=Paenibacillus sp. J5C2022 TaxID=2977129 RepID=UPI0021D0A3F8|nr:response regulator [Paenibacillus sp. J5C2022]MCU6712888.1 response regulator [Paenibacillus sp. J5C2022]